MVECQGRTIALRRDVLDDPVTLDLATIAAEMLWPRDEQKRTDYLNGALILDALERSPIYADHLRDLLVIAAITPSIEELRERAIDRWLLGVKVGHVLSEALGFSALGLENGGLDAITDRMVANLKCDPKGRFANFSRKTFNNSHKREFRPAAHFWAASLVFNKEQFPCKAANLKYFLELAEAFRIAAESKRTKQSPARSLLMATETLKLPPELGISPTKLIFDPV